MWRGIISAMAIAGAAAALAGCGFADSRAPVPEFMRSKASDPPPPEPPPDVKQLVRANPDAIFAAAAHARHIRVSPPRREPNGHAWTACIKAEVNSVVGRSLGTQTYRATISNGVMLDRRRVEADDNCASETYEPVS